MALPTNETLALFTVTVPAAVPPIGVWGHGACGMGHGGMEVEGSYPLTRFGSFT